MQSGIIIINKPKDITSRGVVDLVAKQFKTKRVGHTGTLDPLAEGVLVLGINDGCKIIELLTSTEKEYIAEVVMGYETDTLDVTGTIVKETQVPEVSKESLEKVIQSFLGTYNQEVPLYSAVRINGKRLYEYAREKTEVDLPKREVEIKNIKLLTYHDNSFTFQVTVSKGTYIRSLIKDIGERLNCACTMKELQRIRQGSFTIEESINLDQVDITSPLKTIAEALSEYEKIEVDSNIEFKIKNGQVLPKNFTDKRALIFNKNNELLAIYQEYDKDPKLMKPYKVIIGGSDEKVK